MAITKLTGFSAEAEVMGRMVHIVFNETEGLLLEGLSHDEAMVAIDRLATKSLVGVHPRASVGLDQGPPWNEAPEARPEKIAEAHFDTLKKLGKAAEVKTAPKVETKPEPKTDAAPKIASVPKPPPEPDAVNADGIPEKVAKSGRFIEVMEWVMSSKKLTHGQVDEIVVEVEKLKDLPAVKRVRDIKDKVISNLAAYSEAGAGDAA